MKRRRFDVFSTPLSIRMSHMMKHPSSAINEHLTTSGPGHCVHIEDAKILAVEDNIHARKLREAMKIHQRLPVLNRDTGADIPPPPPSCTASCHMTSVVM